MMRVTVTVRSSSDSDQDLPELLDGSHKAVSSAMAKHLLDIPLPIVPDTA